MPVFTGGGSSVSSANIVDDAIINADVNSAAAIAQSKLAGTPNTSAGLISYESGTSVPYALTTIALQRVLVIVRGSINFNAGTTQTTLQLQYNGVTKDTCNIGTMSTGGNAVLPFVMMYTEVPGAATQNITIVSSAYTPTEINIQVIKL